jgi:hypothetical protein
MVESSKVYDVAQGTITRYLYVIGQAYGSRQNGVALYAHTRVDTIGLYRPVRVLTCERPWIKILPQSVEPRSVGSANNRQISSGL